MAERNLADLGGDPDEIDALLGAADQAARDLDLLEEAEKNLRGRAVEIHKSFVEQCRGGRPLTEGQRGLVLKWLA